MKTTIKGFVHVERNWKGEDEYRFMGCDMSEHGYVMVAPLEFEYEIPADFNPIAAAVAGLEKQLAAEKKEHCDKVIRIERQIADLLCIENTVQA